MKATAPCGYLIFPALAMALLPPAVSPQQNGIQEISVEVMSEGWRLVGDLTLPDSGEPVPGVLMLNQAAGDREPYVSLAQRLAERGIASLRLDLRGHGQSTNLGHFIPGEHQRDPLIWDAEADVVAAHRYLGSRSEIDDSRIAIVGASYSAEEMAEAGRTFQYAQAYVALSAGSFSDASIGDIDASGVPWFFIVTKGERFLTAITASVQQESQSVELLIAPGSEHATGILNSHPDLSERIAVWLTRRLRRPQNAFR